MKDYCHYWKQRRGRGFTRDGSISQELLDISRRATLCAQRRKPRPVFPPLVVLDGPLLETPLAELGSIQLNSSSLSAGPHFHKGSHTHLLLVRLNLYIFRGDDVAPFSLAVRHSSQLHIQQHHGQ